MTGSNNAAGDCAASQDSRDAERLPLEASRLAETLLGAQEEATLSMLASQSAVATLLRSQDQEVALILLEAQDLAAQNLLISQSAVAALLSTHDAEGAASLIEAQDEAASGLSATQSAVAELLNSHDSQGAAILLKAQDVAASTLLASQKELALLLGTHDTEGAEALLKAQDLAAKAMLASQAAVADLLSSHVLEGASVLLEVQDAAAKAMLKSHAELADVLRARDAEGSATLLAAQNEAAAALLASQSAVAELLSAHNKEMAETLLKSQDEAACSLLASQSAVAELLSSHYVRGAMALLDAQVEAAQILLDSQSAVAALLGSHHQEVATITALNAELETRVQERTEQLTAANTRLEMATLAKSDFLASMSHELRTPLNTIIGFSNLLETGMVGELSAEQQKQIEMISGAGKHLLSLVNEVLDLASIEAGRVRIERGPVDVTRLVRSIVESLTVLAKAKGLDLSVTVSPDVGTCVTDGRRLEQVLFNLLGNAVKFTESGSVRLDVGRDEGDVVFAVTDTGRGIPADDLPSIFDEFYQVERPDIGKTEGTGLGLSVSGRLVGLLGGTISVESEPGAGTTFVVKVPADV